MHFNSFIHLLVCFFAGTAFLFSQDTNVVSGTIQNRENSEPLPFASIRLKNHPIGTVSNDEGAFDFYIPRSKRNDTLNVSFIGFNTYEIPLLNIEGPLMIQLSPSTNVLDEVILTEKDPLDYIKKALERLSENYPQNDYQTLAYYRSKFIENSEVINMDKAVFKTYYAKAGDSTQNQHQLLLYEPEEDPKQFQFMREWFEATQEKRRKKAIDDLIIRSRRKRRLSGLQFKVDMKRKISKSPTGSCVILSTNLQDHFHSEFVTAINKYSSHKD